MAAWSERDADSRMNGGCRKLIATKTLRQRRSFLNRNHEQLPATRLPPGVPRRSSNLTTSITAECTLWLNRKPVRYAAVGGPNQVVSASPTTVLARADEVIE
jgi:hypothetical protein